MSYLDRLSKALNPSLSACCVLLHPTSPSSVCFGGLEGVQVAGQGCTCAGGVAGLKHPGPPGTLPKPLSPEECMILDSLPSKLLDNHYVLCSGIVFYSKNSNAATTLAPT